MLKYFSAIASGKVDVEAGIIRRVSVLTEGEAKGHNVFIDGTTLLQVKSQAESFSDGVRVKMNHGTGVESMAGVLKNFSIEGPQLLADFRLLKSSVDYAKIMEMAQIMPGAFGFSISFQNVPEKIAALSYARSTALYSADLVDQPAANPSGLFSQPVDSSPLTTIMLSELQAILKTIGEKITALATKPQNNVELETVKIGLSELGNKISTELAAEILARTELETRLTQSAADLSSAKLSITSLSSVIAANDTNLNAAVAALKLEVKADASSADKITALQTSVSNTLAKLAVSPSTIPAGKPAVTPTLLETKTLTMEQFRALNSADKQAFLKANGKLVD